MLDSRSSFFAIAIAVVALLFSTFSMLLAANVSRAKLPPPLAMVRTRGLELIDDSNNIVGSMKPVPGGGAALDLFSQRSGRNGISLVSTPTSMMVSMVDQHGIRLQMSAGQGDTEIAMFTDSGGSSPAAMLVVSASGTGLTIQRKGGGKAVVK